MSTNPYSSPQFSSPRQPGSAADALRGPAIALLMVSGLFIVLLVGGLSIDGYLFASGALEGRVTANPLVKTKEQEVAVRMVFGGLLIGLHLFVLYGAVSMLRLKNRGAAYAAAIISVIPCCSGCYIVGIPFGIWALIVLNKPEVRDRFV